MPAKFADMDANGSGEVGYEDFLSGFGFKNSALTRKLFDAFDQDQSGEISVVEFIVGLKNWKNFDNNDKMKFTYKIYDLDGSGFIEPDELAECLADTNCEWRGEGGMTKIIRKILKTMENANLLRVDLKDFVALSKKYPSVLFLPLFGLMEQIFSTVTIELADESESEQMSRAEATKYAGPRRKSSSNIVAAGPRKSSAEPRKSSAKQIVRNRRASNVVRPYG